MLPILLYTLTILTIYMSKERSSELRELQFHLERKIRPLEWDANRNQINDFKKLDLEKLQQEQKTLQQELEQQLVSSPELLQ